MRACAGKHRIPPHMKPNKRAIHPKISNTLPVIVDEKGALVSFPHFGIFPDNSVLSSVEFLPALRQSQYGVVLF